MNSLVGKLAIVTGAINGIGTAMSAVDNCLLGPLHAEYSPSILRDARRRKRLRGELGNASSLRRTADLKDDKALLDRLADNRHVLSRGEQYRAPAPVGQGEVTISLKTSMNTIDYGPRGTSRTGSPAGPHHA